MTKQDVIEKAYGEYYLKDNIDENGWTNSVSQGFLNSIPCDTKEMHILFGSPEIWYRPISLRRIENNNSWIKIESENDLPKEIDHNKFKLNYWTSNGFYNSEDYKMLKMHYSHLQITHYQIIPIIKPVPPLY